MRRALATAWAVLWLAGCAGNPVFLGPQGATHWDPEDRVDYTVTECGAQVLLFVPFFSNGRLDRAMTQILAAARDRHVTDVRVRERWLYLVFGAVYCTEVIASTYGPVEKP